MSRVPLLAAPGHSHQPLRWHSQTRTGGHLFRLFLWSEQVGTVYVDCWVRTGGHCFRLILRLEQVGTVYGESWLEQVFTVYAAS